MAIPSYCRDKNVLQYGEGLIVNIPLPEPEVAQVVEEATQNTIIRGTKEYNKDEYVAGAVAATSTPVFPAWTEGGKVFYKVRHHALNPWNFKNSGDVGLLAVRYVVKPQGEKNTVLRIDALFVEDFRKSVHQSNGSVESAEYKDIQERLASVELVKQETAEAEQAKRERALKQRFSTDTDKDSSKNSDNDEDKGKDTVLLSTPSAIEEKAGEGSTDKTTAENTGPQGGAVSPQSAMAQPGVSYGQPGESLEEHVAALRREVQRLVRKPGAPLQSAPFHTATTLKSLEPGAEVLILISTPYWYGVETRDGQHGWIRRDQLERMP